MNKTQLRNKAVQLRKKGRTYGEINKIVHSNIPKSTLSYWCKGIVMNKTQQKRRVILQLKNIKRAQEKARAVHKKNRDRYLKSIESRNTHLEKFLKKKEIAKLLLAMLYLGEGAKWKSHRGLQLGSSNPEIVKLYLKLLEQCFGVRRKTLKAMIYHRADQNLNSLIRFWSKCIGIPALNFYKSKPDVRTKGQKTWKEYRGVCAVFGPGTDIQLELETIAKLFFRN